MRHFIGVLAVVGALVAPTFAQQISVTGPVAPGATIPVQVAVHAGGEEVFWIEPGLYLLSKSGELEHPFLISSDLVYSLGPGESFDIPFEIPLSGPGSSGSHVLLLDSAPRVLTRVDVGVPDAEFPALHAWPERMPKLFWSHSARFDGTDVWEIGNASDHDHVLTSSDFVEVRSADNQLSAYVTLEGVAVRSGRTARVPLPLEGLPPGPYTVQMVWTDPDTGSLERVHHGIQWDSRVNLHVPGGRDVPVGGETTIHVACREFFETEPLYVVALGLLPGTTPFPAGTFLPLAPDTVLVQSLANGLGGLLQNYIGETQQFTEFYGWNGGYSTAEGITLAHPSDTTPVQMELRLAAFAFEPETPDFAVSQMELIRFE